MPSNVRIPLLVAFCFVLSGAVRAAEEPLPADVLLECDGLRIQAAPIYQIERAYLERVRKTQPDFNLTGDERESFRRERAWEFVERAMLKKYAAEHKLVPVPAEVETEFQARKKEIESYGESLAEFYADRAIDEAEHRQMIGVMQAVRKKFQDEVTKAELDEYLKVMDPKVLPLRSFSHIKFGFQGAKECNSTRTREEAKQKAEEVLAKLKAGGDFAKLAAEFSDCPSKNMGGEMGWLAHEKYQLAEKLYALEKVGEVSADIVESDYGFHILKFTGVKTPEEAAREFMGNAKFEQFQTQLRQDCMPKGRFNTAAVTAELPKAAPAPSETKKP